MDDFNHHTLTITEETRPPDLPGGEPIIVRGYALVCPGVTDHCRRWEPCPNPGCTVNTECERYARDAFGHGEHHLWIDDTWMVPTGGCFYAGNRRVPEAAELLGLPAGEHPVDVAYAGDGDIVLAAFPQVGDR